MVKEFENNTDDSSEGGLGRYEGTDPSNALARDARDDSSDDGVHEEDPEADPQEQIDGTETPEKGVVCKDQIAWTAKSLA